MVGGGSRRYNHSDIYHDPSICYSITCVERPRCWPGWGRAVVTDAFYLLSQRVLVYACAIYNNGNEDRRLIKNVTLIEKNTLKK